MTVAGEPSRPQGRSDIHEPQVEAVAGREAEPGRLAHEEEQRIVDGESASRDACDQIDAEQEAPELAVGRGRRRDCLLDVELALRDAERPDVLETVERISHGRAVELEQRPEERAGAATLHSSSLRVCASHQSRERV